VAPGANILGKVRIGARSEVNANAVIIPGVTVGEETVVGVGSVVLRVVEDRVTVFGNPARVVSRAG
jgi:galactoside O-acetyltransferase